MVMSFTVLTITAISSVILSRADAKRAVVAEALKASGISCKDAAITMDVAPQHLSEYLNGKRRLSLDKLAELPDKFWNAFNAIDQESRGGVVITSSKLAQLVHATERMVMARVTSFESTLLERAQEIA